MRVHLKIMWKLSSGSSELEPPTSLWDMLVPCLSWIASESKFMRGSTFISSHCAPSVWADNACNCVNTIFKPHHFNLPATATATVLDNAVWDGGRTVALKVDWDWMEEMDYWIEWKSLLRAKSTFGTLSLQTPATPNNKNLNLIKKLFCNLWQFKICWISNYDFKNWVECRLGVG